ncbi:hypothetical protein [Nostoc sp. UHCC 0870]|uniref:hypothetical protein n=1 Tax=Nostoc sp. UHCC 0870 TaxID=2914041 RepID=UPI001EDD4F90|nr:hypothetical protein [Nostoc sp. UHCC 0870]UKO96620.1 hypothetical protein L6494_18615 [Nostoc sp. UHCC 0870]
MGVATNRKTASAQYIPYDNKPSYRRSFTRNEIFIQHRLNAALPLTALTTQHRLNAALPLTQLSTHNSALTTHNLASAKRRATANTTHNSALITNKLKKILPSALFCDGVGNAKLTLLAKSRR